MHVFDPFSHAEPNMVLHYGDLTDTTNLVYIISQVRPTEIYNLAAQSHVKVSFDMAEYTGDVDGLGTLRLLDAIRTCGLTKHIRFYQVRGDSESEKDSLYQFTQLANGASCLAPVVSPGLDF